MKKLFASILAFVMIFSLTVPAAAQGVDNDWSGVNVSPANPMEAAVPFGTSYPTTKYYPHGNAALPISGTASWSTLWLSNMVLGCDKYYIEIYNVASTPLTCAICRQSSGDIQKTIAAGGSWKITIDADPDEIVCMQFKAPSNFYGSLQCACDG